jgi:cytochrome c553
MKKIITGFMIVSVVGISSLFGGDIKKCYGCHGGDFQKSALGKDTNINILSENEIFNELKAYKEGTLNKYGMGMLMKTQVQNYTDEELQEFSKEIFGMRK